MLAGLTPSTSFTGSIWYCSAVASRPWGDCIAGPGAWARGDALLPTKPGPDRAPTTAKAVQRGTSRATAVFRVRKPSQSQPRPDQYTAHDRATAYRDGPSGWAFGF